MNWSNVSLATAALLLCFSVSLSLQDASASSEAHVSVSTQTNGSTPAGKDSAETDEKKKWAEFMKSNLYLAPFEQDVISLPENQVEFVREVVRKDLEFFRTILREAIDKRHNMAPSMALMFKYSGKLLATLIQNRQKELKLRPRKEQKPTFFGMIAKMLERVIDGSARLKKDKGYTKKNVDTDNLYHRVNGIFNYVQKIIDSSPVAGYHKWEDLVLYKNETGPNHDKDFYEETSDVLAQFRGMGYDSCIVVARKMVGLLHVFAKGIIPSIKDVD